MIKKFSEKSFCNRTISGLILFKPISKLAPSKHSKKRSLPLLIKVCDELTQKSDLSVSLLGCLFHFGQKVWQHIQNKVFSQKYQEDDEFRANIKKLIALALLPADDIIKGYELVIAQLHDDAENFLDSSEGTWLGELK